MRTYVRRQGVPGIWFFSLDASNPLAVAGARTLFGLPYHWARMKCEQDEVITRFHSERVVRPPRGATFAVQWTRQGRARKARPESLEYFLVERYCFYTSTRGRLYRGGIHHAPWRLCGAKVESLDSKMLEYAEQRSDLHAQAESLLVEIYGEEKA